MFRGREHEAVNLACMWRVLVQGLPLSKLGMISEVRLAKIVAVTRIVAGSSIRAMGVHEPRIPSLLAGANQIYAHTAGFSPRRHPNPAYASGDSSRGSGYSVEECRKLLREAGYTPLDGPTKVFRGNWS
jgi:biotin synthase